MTPMIETLCDELEEVCELSTPDDVDSYLQIVSTLRALHDSSCLPCLLCSLRDVDAGEAQYEVVELAESFALEEYIPALLQNWYRIHAKAPTWLTLMLTSCLNSNEHRQFMANWVGLHSVPERRRFEAFLWSIVESHPRYREAVHELCGH